ncbi:hypothetical protein FRB99_002697 [Tulasnella sp. 403]|nr:hypothetical protein FRB99_002697 [Tulasnella sp. 403]
MDVFKEACDRGVVIVTISQCAKGTVSDSYETGRALLNVGVVPGGDMTAPCALTKLAYLLSKPELSVDQVRQLIRTPLRGEMTVATAVPDPTSPELESTAEVLGHMLRLSNTSDAPSIHITPPVQASGQAAKDATAPGSHTASDAASAQSALLPFLIHLAAARNDIEGIRFCVEADDKLFSAIANPGPDSSAGGAGMSANGSGMSTMTIPGGVVNCLDASTKMSPLHVAALNGGLKAVEVLLDYGALVHQRDVLDHTALYYASRQGHESIVRLLITSGAHLGGTDLGYAEIVLMRAKEMSDERMIRIWQVAGGEAVQNSHHTRPHHIHGAGRQDVGHGKHTLLG